MIFSTKSKTALALFLICCTIFVPHHQLLALEKRSQRESIVAPRAKRFYKADRIKQYLSLNGNYTSDYNSKSYEFGSRYFYQSSKFIHEIFLDHDVDYKDVGGGKKKRYAVKTSDLYDLTIANKARIKSTKNYSVFYHRTIYDELSEFYRDSRTALGLGRMFLNEKLEVDLSMSYRDVKNYGYETDIISSWRLNQKLRNNLTFVQRGYFFIDHKSVDNEMKTSLVYRLSDKLSFELRHGFEKRRYGNKANKEVVNQVNRSVNIGFVFDLQ